MQTSPNGVQFIAGFEGFEAMPYNDNGHLAWGYGHDQQPGEPEPASVTKLEAMLLLEEDVARRDAQMAPLMPTDCTQNQWDACASFTYNLGIGALRQMLAHGWEQVPVQMPRWNHKNGVVNDALTKRRAAEVALFNTPE